MKNINDLSIMTMRSLFVDSIEHAGHGHLGMPLGSAPMAYTLFRNIMKQNPHNPRWFNRDRFVLSAGHGSILLYTLLHLSGYDLSIDDLKQYRQVDSKTPGHPERDLDIGVEATTGPLGQGFGMAVGLAIAEAHLSSRFNIGKFNVVDHYTYVICSDGDLQEGVALESAAIAGNLGLNKLIVLYDSNDITLDGPIAYSSSDNIKQKFNAMNWDVMYVEDGEDYDAIQDALLRAQADKSRPTLIEVKNIIGYGSTYANTNSIHSDAVGSVEAQNIKNNIGWEYEEPFYIPKDVKDHFSILGRDGRLLEREWIDLMREYKHEYPKLYHQLNAIISEELKLNEETLQPFHQLLMSTRDASGHMINRMSKNIHALIGGSADLATSNKTEILNKGYMSNKNYTPPNIHYGVREFGMGAISNGLRLHGGLQVYCATFLTFTDYMRSSIRHAALQNNPVIYVMTHDSIHLGPDGPTHQPIEHLMSLRLIPNLTVIRPADANETIAAWDIAIHSESTPTLIALGRHVVPVIKTVNHEGVKRGAYIISKSLMIKEGIIIATGSEVEVAINAQRQLEVEEIYVDVVSMPSFELFEAQTDAYKELVLPKRITKRVSIELGVTTGWEKYVGKDGIALGINHFGASGVGKDVIEKFELDTDRVVRVMRSLILHGK